MKNVAPEYEYSPTPPEDLKAGHPIQELALNLGVGTSTITGWRKNGIPSAFNNALRHILYLEAELAHAKQYIPTGGDRD